MAKPFEDTKKLFTKSRSILLILHEFPDGDTIASSLALYEYLKSAGKKVDLAVKGAIPEFFRFLTAPYKIKSDFLLGDYDLVVAVDCGDAQRTGFPVRVEKISKTKPIINIDHHLANNLKKYAQVNLVDENASAAAELVYQLFEYLGAKINSTIATFILAAIYYDTGGFIHSNVTVETLRIVSECLRYGARIGLITDNIVNSRSSASLRLWGKVLKNMKVKGETVISRISHIDIDACGAQAEDTAGVVNLLNTLPRSKLAILFVDTPDGKIKASLRTEEDSVDVSRLARLFGGGGHKKAAGFTIDKDFAKKSS